MLVPYIMFVGDRGLPPCLAAPDPRPHQPLVAPGYSTFNPELIASHDPTPRFGSGIVFEIPRVDGLDRRVGSCRVGPDRRVGSCRVGSGGVYTLTGLHIYLFVKERSI